MTELSSRRIVPFSGKGEMRSPWFSRTWKLTKDDTVIASAHRSVWRRTSEIQLPDGREWVIRPRGWGVVELVEDDQILARAERLSFLGRAWELTGQSFGYELRARSMALRRWSIELGGGQVAGLHGGVASFNRLTVDAGLPVPLEAVMLTWHVIVRAWEAAAASAGGAS